MNVQAEMPADRDPRVDPRPGDRTHDGTFYRDVTWSDGNMVSYRVSLSKTSRGHVNCIPLRKWHVCNENATVIHVAEVQA